MDYPERFGGLKWSGDQALMDGDIDSPSWWHFPVGIILGTFSPYLPGPRGFLNITEVQLFIKKDC